MIILIRILFPSGREGRRDRSRRRTADGAGTERLDVEGRPRSAGVREDNRERARLYRSPVRWILVLLCWTSLLLLLLLEPFAGPWMLFAPGLGFLAAAGAFALRPRTRMVSSVLLVTGAVLRTTLGGASVLTTAFVLTGLALVLMCTGDR